MNEIGNLLPMNYRDGFNWKIHVLNMLRGQDGWSSYNFTSIITVKSFQQ